MLWLRGGALFFALAVAILSGLLFATVLTLGFVPVPYCLLFRVGFKDFVYEHKKANNNFCSLKT